MYSSRWFGTHLDGMNMADTLSATARLGSRWRREWDVGRCAVGAASGSNPLPPPAAGCPGVEGGESGLSVAPRLSPLRARIPFPRLRRDAPGSRAARVGSRIPFPRLRQDAPGSRAARVGSRIPFPRLRRDAPGSRAARVGSRIPFPRLRQLASPGGTGFAEAVGLGSQPFPR